MSEAITEGVRVRVETEFLPHESNPRERMWVHMYHVAVTNESTAPIQLLNRHWVITNAQGVQEHVSGPGVVGQQPVIRPGETFRYTSGCPLDTEFGTMHGTYEMVREDGSRFEAQVAPFMLTEPHGVN